MASQRIIYSTPEGIAVIVPALECGLTIEEIAAKDVPEGVPYEIVTTDDIPADRTFRSAWAINTGKVDVDIPKAKLIAHDKRRAMRADEFAPYDEIITKQIPGKDAAQAEAERQKIRDKYDKMQADLDKAKTPEQLKTVLGII